MPLNGNSNAFAQIEQMQSLADGFVDDPVLRAKAQEGLVQYLRQQPLLQRYAASVRNSAASGLRIPPTQFGWQAQAERLMHSLLLASGGYQMVNGNDQLVPLEPIAQLSLALLLAGPLCQTYLWKNEIIKIVENMPVPRHVISKDLLPYPVMWWTFEGARRVIGGPELGAETDWFLLNHQKDGVRVITHMSRATSARGSELPYLCSSMVPYGNIYPDDFSEEHIGPIGQILAALAFLASPFVLSGLESLPRSMRREAAKEPSQWGNPDQFQSHIVSLRHPMVRRHPQAGKDGDELVVTDWQHRWWVSGHIRAQWYPSLGSHKLIFIAPHLKGPEDKPLLEKTYLVVR